MHKHEHFDLKLHDDKELSELLQCELATRKTLHEWPLSCVQLVITTKNKRWIYKAQNGPTSEGDFYKTAVSPLLPTVKSVYRSDNYSCQLIEYLDGTTVSRLGLPREELEALGYSLTSEIQQIGGSPPVFLDISDIEKWQAFAEDSLKMLSSLRTAGIFTVTDTSTAEFLVKRFSVKSVQPAYAEETGLCHGDFFGDNIIRVGDDYKVIDWQRCMQGPLGFDLTDLMLHAEYNPPATLPASIVLVRHLVKINWFLQCQTQWFKEGDCYDQWVSDVARKIEGLSW